MIATATWNPTPRGGVSDRPIKRAPHARTKRQKAPPVLAAELLQEYRIRLVRCKLVKPLLGTTTTGSIQEHGKGPSYMYM